LNTYKKTVSLTRSLLAGELPAKVGVLVLAFLRRQAHQIAVLFFYWTIQATA